MIDDNQIGCDLSFSMRFILRLAGNGIISSVCPRQCSDDFFRNAAFERTVLSYRPMVPSAVLEGLLWPCRRLALHPDGIHGKYMQVVV